MTPAEQSVGEGRMKAAPTCEYCGDPRHPFSAYRCRPCYLAEAAYRRSGAMARDDAMDARAENEAAAMKEKGEV